MRPSPGWHGAGGSQARRRGRHERAGLRELMAIIEENLEVLRRTAIHGSGEMKELAIAQLQARGQKLDPGNAPEDAPDESQPFDTPMFPKFPGEGDLPVED
ncbi:MAG TPA: hypothetical protein EYM45_04910 [Verrucomicrobia bacterium]|nr:hypothetical protein [Verrucomicrobiota bacterium]